MAKIKKFEDIESWKRARILTKQIYEITSMGEFGRDFGLKDQIRRAAVSVLSNIAEGFERAETRNSCSSWLLLRDLAENYERSYTWP